MLVVNNVTKTYGKFVALENINLEFSYDESDIQKVIKLINITD